MTESNQYQFTSAKPITVYLADVSYFSGKLEAYLRYKEIPYIRKSVNVKTLVDEVYANTGMMKVPVVRLNNGEWLKDTTPMLEWFEEQECDEKNEITGIYPEDPVDRFVSLLVEDYADEWCWRSALYWRWCFPETKQLLGRRIAREVLGDWPIPENMAAWYFANRQINTFLKGDGLTQETEPYIKQHYLDMLNSMQQILTDSPFLMGERPSIADFGLFGPMFRHFGLDPAPAKVMIEKAPAVYEWLARMWNVKASDLSSSKEPLNFSHHGWAYFLQDITQVYLPSLHANARAWEKGKAHYDLELPELRYPKLRTVHYRVYCLERLQQHYSELTDSDQKRVDRIFKPYGGIDLGDRVDSGLSKEYELPISQSKRELNMVEKLVLMAKGTPWDKPRWLNIRA